MTDFFDILANPAFWVAVLRIATPLILGTLGVLLEVSLKVLPSSLRNRRTSIGPLPSTFKSNKARQRSVSTTFTT